MKYLMILRGINVSGQKKVAMKDLKQMCEKLGCSNVVTYIQSGNVICDCDNDAAALKASIEQAIVQRYSFEVPVLIRTSAELSQIISQCPFAPVDLAVDGTKVLVTFLADTPVDHRQEELMKFVKAPEQLVMADRHVYVYCPNGYGRSKLSNVFIEKKLKIQATTRNWKTINKLYDLSE